MSRDCGTRTVALELYRLPLAVASDGLVSLRLLAELESVRAARMDRRVFVVIVSGPGHRRAQTQMLEVGSAAPDPRQLPVALVIGRHSQCDLRAGLDACLRHALLMAHPPRGGEPSFVEGIDLATGIGLGVGAPEGASRVVAPRALRFGVGSDTVLAFLAEPGEPLFPEGPEAAVEQLDEGSDPGGAFVRMPAAHRALVRGGPMLPPTRGFVVESNIVLKTDAGYELLVGSAQLDRGALLGRYERCFGHQDFEGHTEVSRVHAMVLRRGGRNFVVDCASLNGTALQRADGAIVELGPGHRVASIATDDELRIGGFRIHLGSRSERPGAG